MSKAIIFDFDGTLVDTEALIRKTFISITKDLVPLRLDIAKKVIIGPPLRETAMDILGTEYKKLTNKYINEFIRKHDQELLIYSKAYKKTFVTLSKLNQMGYKMALATNKRQAPTLKIINHFNWDKFFIFIECSDSQHILRDKSQLIKEIIKKNYEFKDSYFVGDTKGDGTAAQINNLKFIKANYGYGNLQDWSTVPIYAEINNIGEIISINRM